MPALRRTVMFRTSAFNTIEPRPYFINPICFGDDLLRWLLTELRAQGIKTADDPEQEDFGWFLRFEVDRCGYCLVVGYRPGPSPNTGLWIGTVERSRGLLGSLLGLRSHGVALSALLVLGDAIARMPGLTAMSWHREEDVRAGIEDRGAPAADAS